MTEPNQLRVYDNILDLVPNPDNPTPMVKLNKRINPNDDFTIYIKLERYNPFGSIKDRIALVMLKGAEIKKNQSIVEPSSGNTGLALVGIANALGIPIEIAVPQRIPEEKKTLLRLLGVKTLWEADDKLCPAFPNEGARGLVNAIMKGKGGSKYVNPNQYENPLNVRAHYKTTGPEIWKQTQGKINYFFAGFGTCGTITGVGRYLKEQNPEIRIVGVEPSSNDHKLPGMKRITGLAEEFIPKILDRSVIDDTVEVTDKNAYKTAIELARKDGILVGPTTGAIAHVALQFAKRHKKGVAVIISPDDAFKYSSFFGPYIREGKKQDMEEINESLNLKGVICPLNFVKTKLKLEEMQDGQILEIIIDDGEPMETVPRSIKEEGHKIVKVEKLQDSSFRLLIKNGGSKSGR